MKNYALLFLMVFSFSLDAQMRLLQVDEFEDYEIALKTVQENHSLMLVALHDGGGELRKMYSDGVFNDPGLLNASKPFTPIAIDIREPMGDRFQTLFAVNELPAFYLMNEEEFVLEILSGYQSAAELKAAMLKAAEAPFRYDSLVKGYQAHQLSDGEWIELLELYALNFDFRATTRLAQEYLNTKSASELIQAPTATILSEYGLSLETIYPQLVIDQQAQLKKQVPDFELKDFLQTAIDFNLDLAILSQDSLLCETICESLVISPLVAKDSLDEIRLNVRREFAWQSGRFALYAEAFKQQMDRKAPNIAADLLFDEAYEIVETFNEESALQGAMVLAQRSDEKQVSFRARMLKAYIAYLQKDSEKANLYLQEARSQVKSPEQLRNLEKLQGLVEEVE